MARYTRLLLFSTLIAVGAAQSCPAVSYSPLPQYPTSAKCAPANYDFELTLGTVSLAEAQTECQEECTASDSDCTDLVIELRKKGDLYDAKCLLFKQGNIAYAPESCDAGCQLQGYHKGPSGYSDNILPCYSAEPEAATTYCQSALSATVTKTVSVTALQASTRLANFTLTAFQNRTMVLTSTIDATTTLTATTTIFTSPTVATTVASFTALVTATTTQTVTATSTSVVTTTMTVGSQKKRDVAATPPACISADVPASKLSSACVVYNAEPMTVTSTTTISTPQVVTRTNRLTLTLTRPVTEYTTITVTSQSETTTVDQIVTDSQTLSLSTTQTNTITSTRTATVTTVTTSTTTRFFTALPTPSCGLPAGFVPSTATTGFITCPQDAAQPSANALLRIEGANDTPFEGCIRAGPRQITTPSGGTHLCDGTNGGANPAPGTTPSTQLDAAARLAGFSFDGSYDNRYQDYLITSIAGSTQTGTSYWGLLVDGSYSPVGGCQFEVTNGDRTLWAYDAFNKTAFLRVSPDYAVLAPGQTTTVSITDDQSGSPYAGANFAGKTSAANGQVVITAPTAPGCYQYKATANSALRSNTFYLNVVEGLGQ